MPVKSLLSCLLLILVLLGNSLQAQEAYRIIDKSGDQISFEEMIDSLKNVRVVFFGEIHNQPICHWLTLEIIKERYNNNPNLQVGMEMFEKDQQRVIDEMEEGIFQASKLSQYTRTWNNYKTDYEPVIEYCMTNGIDVHATNIPRQYASFVFSNGIDSLYTLDIPASYIPKKRMPIDTQQISYAEISKMASQMGHGKGYLLEAQAIKDMTMAETIHNVLKKNKRTNFIHINGVYHTKYGEGIAWYLNYLNSDITISVVSCHESSDFDNFQIPKHDQADFHVLIDEDITKSYD